MKERLTQLINASEWRVNTNKLFNVDGQSTLDSNLEYLSGLKDWRVDQACNLAIKHGIDLYGADKILDAGCGFAVSAIIANLKGLNWIGIEPELEAIGLTKEAALICGLPSNQIDQCIVQGNGESLSFSDNTFSMVVSHQVIEHVKNPKNYLRELLRVLKPGGVILLTAPEYRMCHEPHYGIPWIPFLNKEHCVPWLDIFEKNVDGLSNFNYVSGAEVKVLAATIGFESVKLTYCTRSTSERVFKKDILRMMRDSNPLTTNHTEIARIAKRVKENNESFKGDSFQIIAKKSSDKKKKAFFWSF
jgi:SAM-dependent methyltransferase